MRFLMACMLLCGAAVGYSQEEEAPVAVVEADETESQEVAVEDSFSAKNWNCGCGPKSNKPK